MGSTTEHAAHDFCENPHWSSGVWLATTFRGHPSSEAPPVMGLVFADWPKGVGIFRTWVEACGNVDEHDDIRIAVINSPGNEPDAKDSYVVRISPAMAEYLDVPEDPRQAIGQVQRMYPNRGGDPAMLPAFKREYLKHGEFLLAPVVMRDDGQLWFNVQQGIIKRELILRHASEIGEHELDALAVRESNKPTFTISAMNDPNQSVER